MQANNKNIASKLVKVMKDCSFVQKQGVNDFHGYKYATSEDVMKIVNKSLTENRLMTAVDSEVTSMVDVVNLKCKTEHLATVKVTVTIIDSETSESIVISGVGSGQDAGDKAVMKASTAAIKYAYMLSLCIATGDDPEADSRLDNDNYDKEITPTPATDTLSTTSAGKQNVVIVPNCEACGAEVKNDKVASYSKQRVNRTLCYSCQKQIAG